jgi:hypothetical protein
MPTTDEAVVRDYFQRILDFYGKHLAAEVTPEVASGAGEP